MNDQTVDESQARRVLACLGVVSRFRLVKALTEAQLCVGELAVAVGLSQSCTTRHLQELERVGLVRGTREGRRVRFRLCAEGVGPGWMLGWILRGTGLRNSMADAGAAPAGQAAPSGRRREQGAASRRGREADLSSRQPARRRADTSRAGASDGQPQAPAAQAGVSRGNGPASRPTALRPGDLEDYLL